MKDLSSYRLYIFGADDTLRRCMVPGQPSPYAPGEWEIIPGVRERLTDGTFNWQGRHIFAIASNQPGISIDLLTETTALQMLISTSAAATGVYPRSGSIEFCHHCPDDRCECRKPGPGMLKALMRTFRVQPEETIMIGSQEIDHAASRVAGIDFMDACEFFAWEDPGKLWLLADLTRDQIVAGANQLGRKGMDFSGMLERRFKDSFITDGPFHPDWQSPAYGAPRFPLRMINFPKPSPHHYHVNPFVDAMPEPTATSEDLEPEAADALLAGRQLGEAILRCQLRERAGTCGSIMQRVEDDASHSPVHVPSPAEAKQFLLDMEALGFNDSCLTLPPGVSVDRLEARVPQEPENEIFYSTWELRSEDSPARYSRVTRARVAGAPDEQE